MYRLVVLLVTALVLQFPAGDIQAAGYPDKPITIVAPYGAGGAADLAARTLASAAQKHLGQPVMVVNRIGAGGASGSHFVLNAKPDGYTLLLARVGSQSVYPAQKLPNRLYEWDSFAFLALLDENPYVIVVQSKSSYKTMQDLAAAIKANPGKLKYSHSGTATVLSLGPQILSKELGLSVQATVGVPFTSDGDSKVALMAGNVDFLGANLSGVIDQVKGGGLRVLGVSTKERLKELPDVPTFAEAGFPALMAVSGWNGLYAPKALSQEATQVWVEVIKKVSADPNWRDVTVSMGSIPLMLSPAETKEYVRRQIEVFSKIYADDK